MVVDRPYGTEARIKHMNTTCHVERLRESSAVYPRASRLASALGREILCGSAMVGDCIQTVYSDRMGVYTTDGLGLVRWPRRCGFVCCVGKCQEVARENERMRSRGYNWVRERWDAGWPVGGTKKRKTENGKGEEEMDWKIGQNPVCRAAFLFT